MQSTAFMPHHLPFLDFVLQPNINNNNNNSQYCSSSSITTTNVHYDPNNMTILSNAAANSDHHHHLPAAAASAVVFQPHFQVDPNDHMNNSSSAAGMFMDVVTTKNIEEEYPINNVGHSIKSVEYQKAAVMADKRKRKSGFHISYKERKEYSGETKKAKGLIYEGHDQEGQADEEPPKEYIHVRARRGQATDSHSLAERVRREKISERMRMLQELVPGCDKVTGKALMLDEIINYVQSLQNQVEFLSMKLASVNPVVYNFNMDLEDYNLKPDHHQGQMPAQFPAALQDASLLFTNVELQSDDQSTIVGLFSTQDAIMSNTSYNKTANSSHSTVLPPTLPSMESGCNDWTASGDIDQKQKFLDQAHVLKRMGYF